MTSKSQLWACSFPHTIGYPTIRIRCLWTRKFSYPQKNICGKKNFPIRVDMDENCFRARSSTITSLTMVSPFLSRRIVLLSRLKMCILIGFSTGPSLSVPQWNSLNESLFQVLQRVLRFNFRVQLPFFLELIINWHCCCLNSLRFSQRQVVASSTIDPVSTSDNQKNKIKKVFFYIFWSEPTVSGKRLADSLSSAVELHEPWKTSEFSRTSRIKSNKNTDSTTYKHEYIKSWLIKKLTPWSILHFSLRSNLKQFRQAHCQIPYWWNHIECCKLLAQYHAGSKGCVLIHSFTFLLLFLWLLATKYTKYIGEKQKT